jgi:hypothetical protein
MATIPAAKMARAYVELPAPQPKIGGLYSVATVVDVDDPHILMGAHAQTDACEPAKEWEHKCPIEFPGQCSIADDPNRQKKVGHGFDTIEGDPFTVYDMIECRDKADYTAEVRASLALKEQKAVERHVMHVLNHLSEPDALSPTSIVEAIAVAEDYLARNYEGLGLIHLTPGTAVAAVAAEAVFVGLNGGLATALGTPVVAGAGYTSAKPSEVFASGQIVLYRGPVIAQNVPGTQNGAECAPPRALAERTFVPLVECGVVKITITSP